MKNYNKSEIMARAWRFLKKEPFLSFGDCLFLSWEVAKKDRIITPQKLNRIFNSLKPICICTTKDHFKLLNSKKYKTIMKSSEQTETKEMLAKGIVFANDILHQRRLDSKRFAFQIKKEKPFRNRIINLDTCQKINIEEYVNSENR